MSRLQRALLLFLFLASLLSFFATLIPLPSSVSTVQLDGYRIASFTDNAALAALLDGCEVTVRYPEKVWAGDSFEITLRIREKKQSGPASAAVLAGGKAVAVARLEMDAEGAPRGESRQPLLPGKEIHFTWKVGFTRPDPIVGKIWLHVDWVTPNDSESESILLLARPVSIQEIWFLEVAASRVRVIAGLGMAWALLGGSLLLRKSVPPWKSWWTNYLKIVKKVISISRNKGVFSNL